MSLIRALKKEREVTQNYCDELTKIFYTHYTKRTLRFDPIN